MENIKNYVQLTPNLATSGQPTEKQLRAISQAGYAAVVNLAMPDHGDSIDHEGRLVTELGMGYFHIPVPFDNPTSEHVRLFCKIMEALKGKRVWVHCIMNYRVSAFMFHYLHKVEGLAQSESKSPLLKHWKPGRQWRAIMSLSSDEIGL